eukprot:TRINITY_DN16904_c0_g1_i1.p1 TRINITY_DN16904_c0_g1~~TRINITY_DN16904_c0_g1_i1.p1  ORF type:complete len:270 (+),score=59.17 TRINITY_DN16904_c0_g1_i1:40-810(+)
MTTLEEYLLTKKLPPGAKVVVREVSVNREARVLSMEFRFDGDLTVDRRPLLLRPEPLTKNTMQTGLRVWDCGVVLAKHLDAAFPVGGLRGQRVLEVGCGTGISGLAAALKGADVTLTDLPVLQTSVEAHISLNQPAITHACGSARFRPLDWDRMDAAIAGETYDLILASDCVWHKQHVAPFIRVLRAICSAASRPCTVLMGHKLRDEDVGAPFFRALADAGFSQTAVPPPEVARGNDRIGLWALRWQGAPPPPPHR